jgi:hypothetical protein
LNIYSKFSINELYLTFTIVNSCNDCKSSSRKELQYIEKTSHVVKSKIEINTNHFYLGIFLHERLHENINSNTTNLFLINRDSEKLPPVYIGDRTVKLVMNDYNQKKNNNIDMFVNINGKYGLVMKDESHLGNWGVESTPSNYIRDNLYIGKYVISVMKEIGFGFTMSKN